MKQPAVEQIEKRVAMGANEGAEESGNMARAIDIVRVCAVMTGLAVNEGALTQENGLAKAGGSQRR